MKDIWVGLWKKTVLAHEAPYNKNVIFLEISIVFSEKKWEIFGNWLRIKKSNQSGMLSQKVIVNYQYQILTYFFEKKNANFEEPSPKTKKIIHFSSKMQQESAFHFYRKVV